MPSMWPCATAAAARPGPQAQLTEQEAVLLPETSSLVLPLSHGAYLVGLLVIERDNPESTEDDDDGEYWR